MSRELTPSQTIGPFYFGTLVNGCRADLAPTGVAGERIELALSLHDVDGALIPDGLLKSGRPTAHGRYNHPDDRRNLALDTGFDGFGRASTDATGVARFATVRPGRVPWPEAACRRRTSASPSSPAACSIGWRHGSISTAIRRWPRIPC